MSLLLKFIQILLFTAFVFCLLATIGGLNLQGLKGASWLTGAITYFQPFANSTETQFYTIRFYTSLWSFCQQSDLEPNVDCFQLDSQQVTGSSEANHDGFSQSLPYIHIGSGVIQIGVLIASFTPLKRIVIAPLSLVAVMGQLAASGTALFHTEWLKGVLEDYFSSTGEGAALPDASQLADTFVSLSGACWFSVVSMCLVVLSSVLTFIMVYLRVREDKKNKALQNIALDDYNY